MLTLRGVTFGYGGEPALRDVSLEVRAGDRVGLLGASGSGKTTLFLLLAGLRRPQRGAVAAASGGTARRQLPSLVMQFPERQIFAESVREDVAYGLRESGVPPQEVAARVDEALTDVGLQPAEFAERVPFHLSGGEMRRATLAGALAQQRPLLLLDEPTLGLDSEGVERLQVLLERVHARGVACWIASHDADFVAATCERIVALDRGRVAFDGAAAEFWGDAERAERLGASLPRAAVYARDLGVPGSATLPDASEIATGLLRG